MGKLMRATKWAQREFSEGSVPTSRTLRRWIETGVVRGTVIEDISYIEEDQSFVLSVKTAQVVDELVKLS
ncbi:hypothetical protein [Aliagarivorans marinus]|uniref:hypothetical protein n=1 Tax=Aliagarivorans marinus TaxID=561965 RepID=UPI00047A3BB2|nr:hypothetical protein [Aliagarivorans marinus]